MLGVTRVPAKYRYAFLQFDDAFCQSQNYTSFTHLASALIIAQGAWTVSDLSDQLSREDEKARRTYNHFFTGATWDQADLAQALLSYLVTRLNIGKGDELRLHIDDSFSRKFGDATDGVGNFRNGSTGEVEDGNVIVTSCLQYAGLYVPFRPVLYLGEDEADTLDQPFQTKLEIAVDKIVEPLQLPSGAAVTVVTDSAYYSKETINRILAQGYDIVCRLKSDKHVRPLDRVGTRCVSDHIDELSFEELTVCVRDKQKTYDVAETIVELSGPDILIKLVVSESDGNRRYYMSTDLDRSAVEILEFAEDRWNIETFHQQAAEEFGMKDYELESKDGIERFLQLVCIIWTLIVLEEVGDESALWEENAKIGDRLSQARTAFGVETLMKFSEQVESSLPEAERRQIAREYVA
jgi:hypothetical protein